MKNWQGKLWLALGGLFLIIGVIGIFIPLLPTTPFLILAFYAVLGGMVLRYCLGFLVQIFGFDGFSGQGSGFFSWLLYSDSNMLLFLVLFMACTMVIVMGGIKGGIEKFSKAVMPALGVIPYLVEPSNLDF